MAWSPPEVEADTDFVPPEVQSSGWTPPESRQTDPAPQESEELGYIEGALKGLGRGAGQVLGGLAGAMRAGSEALGEIPYAQTINNLTIKAYRGLGIPEDLIPAEGSNSNFSAALSEVGSQIQQDLAPSESVQAGTFQPANPRWWTERGTETVSQLLGAVGLAALTKNPIATFTATSLAQNVGQVYNEALEDRRLKGEDPVKAEDEAAKEGFVVGSIMGALDAVPAFRFFGDNPAAKKVVQGTISRIAKSALTEGGTETLQQVVQDLGAYGFRDEAKTVQEYLEGYGASFALGALGGGTAEVALGAARNVGPATEQAVSNQVQTDQDGIRATIEPETPEIRPESPILGSFEARLASEDLEGADSLLINPDEAFQTPSDILNETQNPEVTVQSEGIPADQVNLEPLGATESAVNEEAFQVGETDSPASMAFAALAPDVLASTRQWSPLFQSAGINLNNAEVREDFPNAMRVNWTPEGMPVLEINPNVLKGLNIDQANAILDEELVHAEHVNVMRDSWDKASGTFDQHLGSEIAKVIEEGRRIGLSKESSEIYGNQAYAEGFEIIRQIVQGRRTGTVAEAIINPQSEQTIFKLLRSLLDKFKSALQTNPNSTIASYVRNIETALYGKSDVEAQTPVQGGLSGTLAALQNQANAPPGATPANTEYLRQQLRDMGMAEDSIAVTDAEDLPSLVEYMQKKSAQKPRDIEASKVRNSQDFLDRKVVNSYKRKIKKGESIEPIKAVYDPVSDQYQIENGHHRFEAYKELGYKSIPMLVVNEGNAVTENFLQPPGAAPIQPESPSSYTEYQGKQFPVYSAEKIKKSQGAFGANYYYAPNTQATWSLAANQFLDQFPSTTEGVMQAIRLSQDPSAPMDDATRNYVFSQAQVRLIELSKSANLIHRQQALNAIDQIGAGYLQSGTSQAQGLASRAGANKLLQPYSGWLSGRKILVERQAQEIDKHFDPQPEVKVRQQAQDAGRKAGEELVQAAEASTETPVSKDFDRLIGSELRRMLNQINRSEGISWADIFRNMPLEAQRERQAYMKRMISGHPALQNLTEAQQERLNNAIQLIWAKSRQRIFRDNLNREGALGERTKADREKVIAEAPKLLQYLNTGNLSAADFRDILANRYGIAQLNGKDMEELKALAFQAYNAPEGVIRNKILDQINRKLFGLAGVSPYKILKDVWFAGVLSSPRTWMDIMTGGFITSAGMNLTQALDVGVWQRNPKRGYQVLTGFWNAVGDAMLSAGDIIKTGDYSRLADTDMQWNSVLDGKSDPARLEYLKEQANFFQNPAKWTVAQSAYVRRIIVALDYISSLPTREANLLYIANLVSPEAYTEAEKKYNKEQSAAAEQQAKDEMGPKAKKQDIAKRKREILEANIDEELSERATDMGRFAALNIDPVGLGGIIQQRVFANMPFWVKAPFGLAFSRVAINMVQIASNSTPILGGVNYARAHPVARQWVDGIFPGDKGKRSEIAEALTPTLQQERLRNIAAYQMVGLGMTLTLAIAALGQDEEDRWFDLSGSWYGMNPKQKAQLNDQKERVLSIGLGPKENRVWISYKNLPMLAQPMAMIGNIRDKQRFRPKDWEKESVMERLLNGWAGGLYYFKDLSFLSTLSNTLGQSSYSDNDFNDLNKAIGNLGGSFASGFIPFSSFQKDVDAWIDDNRYKPEAGFDYWITNIPFARRTAGEGPQVNALGDPIKVERLPWSRIVSFQKDDPTSLFLSDQTKNGNFTPIASTPDVFDPKTQEKVSLKELSPALYYEYQVESGKLFKSLLEANKAAIERLPAEEAKKALEQLRNAANREAKGRIQNKLMRQ